LILNYQKVLPILQEEGVSGINTRKLHEQLKLSRQYDKWIDNMIEQLDLQEGIDIKSLKTISKTKDDGRPKIDYFVDLENAKEMAMIAGIGNRVNKETKEISKIARRYFIYIEKAFKNRVERNQDRDDTLIKCKNIAWCNNKV
jgi:anti-repressor protein